MFLDISLVSSRLTKMFDLFEMKPVMFIIEQTNSYDKAGDAIKGEWGAKFDFAKYLLIHYFHV